MEVKFAPVVSLTHRKVNMITFVYDLLDSFKVKSVHVLFIAHHLFKRVNVNLPALPGEFDYSDRLAVSFFGRDFFAYLKNKSVLCTTFISSSSYPGFRQ
jgi:hypothetical protein